MRIFEKCFQESEKHYLLPFFYFGHRELKLKYIVENKYSVSFFESCGDKERWVASM